MAGFRRQCGVDGSCSGCSRSRVRRCVGFRSASLAATDQFRSASSAEGRRKVALKWVMARHTNDLRLPRDFITELAAAAHKATSGQLGLL